jgi:hypothetical protein
VFRVIGVLVLAVGFSLVSASPAWAYIDPGTSSLAYQVLVAGALAIGFFVRRAWKRLVGIIRSHRRPQPFSNDKRRSP